MFKNYEDLKNHDVKQTVNLLNFLVGTVPIEKIIICTVDDENETAIMIGANGTQPNLESASEEDTKKYWKTHLQEIIKIM